MMYYHTDIIFPGCSPEACQYCSYFDNNSSMYYWGGKWWCTVERMMTTFVTSSIPAHSHYINGSGYGNYASSSGTGGPGYYGYSSNNYPTYVGSSGGVGYSYASNSLFYTPPKEKEYPNELCPSFEFREENWDQVYSNLFDATWNQGMDLLTRRGKIIDEEYK